MRFRDLLGVSYEETIPPPPMPPTMHVWGVTFHCGQDHSWNFLTRTARDRFVDRISAEVAGDQWLDIGRTRYRTAHISMIVLYEHDQLVFPGELAFLRENTDTWGNSEEVRP